MLTPTTSRPLSPRAVVDELWRTDKPLTAVGVLMSAVLIASLAGMLVDHRVVTGAPVWLKPSKFAASTAIYALTLAWVFRYLADWRRVRAVVGWTTAIIFVLEVAIIDAQAWRGTTSHFNVSTPLNAVLFATMGIGIAVQTLASILVAAALWRQTFVDPVTGWALRAGMTITVIGAMTGGLMTQPTEAQLAQARATRHLTVSGAHTVGAPDGGPGIPGTGWSREHGDLRVPHFVGLHAIQALALAAVFVRRSSRSSVALMKAVSASYVALFAVLLWQALRGEPVLGPGAATGVALAAWAAASASALWVAYVRGTAQRAAPVLAR
jgi:hypothetical protein